MQNQRTTPAALPDDLPELSPRELAFVEAIGEGLDNTAAYRKAYGAADYAPAVLRVRACQKAAEEKIQAHLRSLRAVGLHNANLTLADRIEDERAFMQRCEDAGNMGAAGGARDRLNKLLGLYVERSEVHIANDPDATLKELAAIIGEDAEAIEVKH